MKINLSAIFAGIFMVIGPVSLFAQAAPPASTPISGLEIALAGGVIYGAKKLYDHGRKNSRS